jgi:hypothetical protein
VGHRQPLLCREALPGLGQQGPRSSNAGSFLGPAAGVRTTSLSSLVIVSLTPSRTFFSRSRIRSASFRVRWTDRMDLTLDRRGPRMSSLTAQLSRCAVATFPFPAPHCSFVLLVGHHQPLLCREALPGLGQHGPRSSNAGSFLGPAAGVRTTSLSFLVWDTTMTIATATTAMVGCAAATLGGQQITSVGGSSSLSAHRSSMQRGLIACGVMLCRGCRRHSWAPAAQPGWPCDRPSGDAMRPSVFCFASAASRVFMPGPCRRA